MSTRKTNVPSIPEIARSEHSVDAALKALKEAVEVGYGRRGDKLDRFVTLRDLEGSGIAKVAGGRIVGSGLGGPQGPPGPPGGGGGGIDDGSTDFTPPPAPTGVQGRGVPPNSIMLTWDPPGYHNHAFAEIFVLLENPDGSAPTLGDLTVNLAANLVGTAAGTIFMHRDLVNVPRAGQDPLDAALNPSVRYYWVRFVSTANVRGPLAPLNGAPAVMSIDPVLVLDEMIRNVRSTSIYQNLRGWIGTETNDPILSAGGVRAYINDQDDAVIGTVEGYLERIIGISDPANFAGQSIFQRLDYIQGEAYPDRAALRNIQTWQAALSTRANPDGEPVSLTMLSWEKSLTFVRIDLNGFGASSGAFPVGAAVVIEADIGDPLWPISGTVVNVVSTTISGVFVSASQAVMDTLPAGPFGAAATRRLRTDGPGTQEFIDFIASVQRNIFVEVDEDSAIGQELTSVSARIGFPTDPAATGPNVGSLWAQTNALNQASVSLSGRLENLWSVNMRQEANGLVYSAGFGLSLETDAVTGESVSTFLVNANQFALMTNSGGVPGAGVIGIRSTVIGLDVFAHIYLATGAHGFNTTTRRAVFLSGSDGQVRIDENTVLESPFRGVAGFDGEVFATGSELGLPYIQCRFPNAAAAYQAPGGWANPLDVNYNGTWVSRFSAAALPPTSIPFVVDVVRGVVGIRGRLIVDGLVRATQGEFDELIAGSAFIDHLQAEVVNANVVIGQRLIAGTPGAGALTPGDYSSISNYIVELNNPITNQYPLRYWKPSTGHHAFYVDRDSNLFVGGSMSVLGNGVIRTSGSSLFSVGGPGADGNYAMWVGPAVNYGAAGEARSEATGTFWIKDNGRAGFNAQLFLGNNAFDLPFVAAGDGPGANITQTTSSVRATSQYPTAVSSAITIRSRRDGTAATYVIWVQGMLASSDESGWTNGNDKRFDVIVDLIGSQDPGAPAVATIQAFTYDDWAPETMPFCYFGAVQVPAGTYYVRIRYLYREDRRMAICRGWSVVAMAVQSNAGILPPGVAPTPPGMPLPGGVSNPPPDPAPPPVVPPGTIPQ